MRPQRTFFLVLVLALLLPAFAFLDSSAATPANFASTKNSIASAFTSVQNAEKSGGNVSSLIARLNVAVDLYQKAQLENSTNPSQAAIDLQNATSIASEVSSQSAAVARSGASSTQVRNEVAIGSAAGVVVIAVLLYVYGAQIYRRIWLFLYRDYVVRRTDE